MKVPMATTQVVMEFARRTPADEPTLDRLATASLEALNRDARFLAFGPVVSVDYERSVIEVECTLCSDVSAGDDTEADVDSKIERLSEIVRNAA